MKNKLEKLVQTGAIILPLLGGCNSRYNDGISSIVIDPDYPTSEDHLDCMVLELKYVGEYEQFIETASGERFDFYWLVNEEAVYSEQGNGWSRLDKSYTQMGDEVVCSVFTPESTISIGYAKTYIN